MAYLPACSPAAVSLASCPDGSPGVSNIYYAQRSDIASLSVTSGAVTAITMDTGAVFYEIQCDEQATSFSETMADGLRYATKTTQDLTLQIPGVSDTIQQQLLSIKNCCDIVLVVKLNNGVQKIVGYDIDYSDDTYVNKNCQFTQFNFVSQSAADDDYARFEGAATCTATGLAPIFTGTVPT
jgi:uncharacterized protein YecE (DUF72 family)